MGRCALAALILCLAVPAGADTGAGPQPAPPTPAIAEPRGAERLRWGTGGHRDNFIHARFSMERI